MNWIDEIKKISQSGEAAAICTVVETRGSAPRQAGAKMIVYENGNISGTIGGGNLEKEVIQNAIRQIRENKPCLFRHDLLHQHSMCCGGTVEIFIEPVKTKNTLYIFGAGHTGKALAKLAPDLDFETYIIDDREAYISGIVIPEVNKLNFKHSDILPSLPFDRNTYVVIMTYDHSYDRDILAFCIRKPHAYLGMIGSRRKVELTKKMFAAARIADTHELSCADMPMGIDINAETPSEIAISIMAAILKKRNSQDMKRNNQEVKQAIIQEA